MVHLSEIILNEGRMEVPPVLYNKLLNIINLFIKSIYFRLKKLDKKTKIADWIDQLSSVPDDEYTGFKNKISTV